MHACSQFAVEWLESRLLLSGSGPEIAADGSPPQEDYLLHVPAVEAEDDQVPVGSTSDWLLGVPVEGMAVQAADLPASAIHDAWKQVQDSSMIQGFLEKAIRSPSATFDTISALVNSQLETINAHLPLGIQANTQVTFGLAAEGSVDVGADAVVLGVNLNALELSTGYNLTYSFLSEQWKLARAFEAKFAFLNVAAEYYVELPSLLSLASTDHLTFGVSFAPGTNVRAKAESAPVILDGAPIALGPLGELEASLADTLTYTASTDLQVEDFLANYVQEETLTEGLAHFFIPGYGNTWWETLLDATQRLVPAVIPIGHLLRLAARDSPLGLLAASGDVSVSASLGRGLSGAAWAGLGAKLSVGILNADGGVKVGVALTHSAEKVLGAVDHVLTWEPQPPPPPGPAEIAEWFRGLDITPTGATVITHGFGTDGDSLMPLARAVRARAGGWLLDYDVSGLGQQGYFDLAPGQSILPKATERGAFGEVVLLFDWSPETTQLTAGWGEAAGDALFSTLLELGLVDSVGQNVNIPLHFIGHSFGTAVTSEAVERLARLGVPVDHVTYLDPHDFAQDSPVPLVFDTTQRLFTLGQPSGYGATVWSNVRFADVYYETRGANGLSRNNGIGVPVSRPIPGAYNVLLDTELPDMSGSVNPYPRSYVSGDHSYVWESFYLATVTGILPAQAHSPPPTRAVNYGQTGYAYSRVAQGRLSRPAPAFYSTPGALQDHRYSAPALVDTSTGQPNLPGLAAAGLTVAQVTQGRWAPQWNPLLITNGAFENAALNLPLVTNVQPGWSHHGGGGAGHVEEDDGNRYLELDFLNPSRTHNRFYIPREATHLTFQMRIDLAVPGSELLVRLGGQTLALYSLSQGTTSFQEERLMLPRQDLRGRTNTLTFALAAGSTGLQSQVRIDNVRLESDNAFLGRTGDVIPVDLKSKTGGASFELIGFDPVPTSIVTESTGDWLLRNDEGQVYGRVVFPERLGEAPFRSSGRFYFLPGTVPDGVLDEDPSSAGVQGVVLGRVKVDDQAREFQIVVGPDFSSRGPNVVTGGTTSLEIMRLQQRLRFLGYPGADGAMLLVDGIRGSATQHAIGLFNAAVHPGLITPVPASAVNLDWINDANAPRWLELIPTFNSSFAPGTVQRWSTDWMLDLIQAAAARWRGALMAPHPDFTFLRASDPSGRTSAALATGGPGRVLELDTPGTDELFGPAGNLANPFFAVVRAPNSGAFYMAAPDGGVIRRRTGGGYEAADPSGPGFDWSQALRAEDAWDNQSVLASLKDAQGRWLLVDAPGYSLEAVRGQLHSFADFVEGTGGGIQVRSVFYNDPRTWDLAGVTFRSGNNGHATIELGVALIPLGQQEKLLAGAEGIRDAAQGLESLDLFAENLPFVGPAAADQPPLTGLVEQTIRARMEAYFAADPTPTSAELSHALSTPAQAPSRAAGMQQAASARAPPLNANEVPALRVVVRDVRASNEELRFEVALEVRRSVPRVLTAGSSAQAVGIAFDASASAALNTALTLSFRFGLNLAPELAAAEAFFIEAERLLLQASLRAANLAFGADIRSFRVAVSGGTLELDATLPVDFEGARLSLRQLETGAWGARAEVGPPEIRSRAVLPVMTEPFSLGDLRLTLSGTLTFLNGSIDYTLTAVMAGRLLPALEILPLAPNDPSRLTFSKDQGLALRARGRAFGLGLTLEGTLPDLETFSFTARADPFQIGGVTVTLQGSVFRNSLGSALDLSATVTDWAPVPFLTVRSLTVTLDASGFRLETTTRIAGVDGVRLAGTYRLEDGAFQLAAAAPVNWTLLTGVSLSNVWFTLSNLNADGSKGDTRVGARADLQLFGASFDVQGSVTGQGAWIAARPKESWAPIPGLTLEEPVVVASTYAFTLSVSTWTEVELAGAPNAADLRPILAGVNLVASTRLPENVPGLGGSQAQISGLLGTTPAEMALEAKLVLSRPPEIAGLFAFDSVGLRIAGGLSLTLFGDGRVLQDRIPGLGQDISVRAGLTLDLVRTTLSGSLSLLAPVNNIFGVRGLNLLEGDGVFGINFATTPLPLPVIGFNFVVETPSLAQDLLALPPKLGAGFNASTTAPIMAMSVADWQPLAKLGLTNLHVDEGTFVYAPNGGQIGQKIFPRGMSASFTANLFGVDAHFLGRLDEQTQGAELDAYVAALRIAGLHLTGSGPDGIYQDGELYGGIEDPDHDNGASFRASLTPNRQSLTLSARINLPGKDQSGKAAFIAVEGQINSNGVKLEGQVERWQIVPAVLTVNSASFAADISFAAPEESSLAFAGDLELLRTPIQLQGLISRDGVQFTGTLKNPGTFGGVAVGSFTLSVSTRPADAHAALEFTLDLPGAGGLTAIRGAFENGLIALDAQIRDWRPLPGLEFDGALQARLPLDAESAELNFDVTGNVLGVATRFLGVVSASPGGFELFATGVVALRLPNGRQLLDLAATIDLGQNAAFAVALAGDFSLPGAEAAEVRIEGSIGSSGVSLFGRIDDWGLVPGLRFDGLVAIRFGTVLAPLPGVLQPGRGLRIDPLPTAGDSLRVEIDVSSVLLATELRLTGRLIDGGPSGFDLDLTGRIHLGGPLVGLVSLDLSARLVTTGGRDGRVYRLAFDGDLQLFAGATRVRVEATLNSTATGRWNMTVSGGVNFHYDATIDGLINLTLTVRIEGTLRFGSRPSDLAFSLRAEGTARAEAPRWDLSASVSVSAGISVDLDGGSIRIPNARPDLHYAVRGGPPTGINWKDLVRDAADTAEPRPSVTARLSNPRNGGPIVNPGEAGVLVIRGSGLSERAEVSRRVLFQPAFRDELLARATNEVGDWQILLVVPTSQVQRIDVDMGAGNDTFEIISASSPLTTITIPATLRGGPGSDILTGGSGANVLYGNREGDEDAALDGDDLLTGGSGSDLLHGQGGNDILRGVGGADTLDGGSGVNVLNGTLQVAGSSGGDELLVSGFAVRFAGPGRVVAAKPGLSVQRALPGSASVTVSRLPLDEVQRIDVDGRGGNDVIAIAPDVLLPATLRGGLGSDRLQAGGGPARIYGGDGPDQLHGGPGNDFLSGEEGDDVLWAGPGDDLLDGGPGQNTLHPGPGANTIQASESDFVPGEGGADTLLGGRPTVRGVEWNNGFAQRSRVTSLLLAFTRDVSASLKTGRVLLRAWDGELIPSSALALSWNAALNTASLTFPGLPEGRLPEGRYTLTLAAGEITDASGTPVMEFSEEITVLAGDATGDGQVNDLDLYRVWQALLQSGSPSAGNEDLDGDGQVTAADLELVRSRYRRALDP